MKLVSELIRDLQALRDRHGDIPVVTSDYCQETIPDDDAHATFQEKSVWDSEAGKRIDCIIII